ncbi:trehalose 6-phosphate synthase [Tistlia consotensis]|uniref:Trehalose 6-phosphate synthase n=1 Tax=Tistlia consotensis USBA 355 TaxID=560819 RepID=A0A1Y6BUN1_9PROT|nr:trehalose-6-phosphate synthase [Tistlia consotensis]SMF27919.1 trehalose 6-phosphate synthase [Tistlia consotensis USBA 355]SNR65460.1 trehalose 6-phosphate synthase [Tistlia consotensis]
MTRIAIVSNRLPSLDRQAASAGGLAVALSAALAESGGMWLGWNGTVSSEPDDGVRLRQSTPYEIVSLALSEQEHAGYYQGFANRVLWPLLHGRMDLVRFDPQEFAIYRGVNARFAKQLAARAAGADVIWVHDYHFLLLGEELRRLGVGTAAGFFLHVPFPAPDTLLVLPRSRQIVRALTAFDLVGFQTQNDLRNFREFVVRHLGGTVSDDGSVQVPGRRFVADAFPIGIDTRRFTELAASKEAGQLRARLSGCLGGQLGMIGVDRLDYTKGLEHRLLAFERMLEARPARRQRASLLQIAAPSREGIPEYHDLKDRLESLSGRINARHATIDWTPVRYLNRAFSQTRLAALYRLSRIGLVTPLRDGMNLVAKEYVAAQRSDDPGVLVLSHFAGAAERLRGALLVNPYDIGSMAGAMRQALDMSLDERRERWSAMIAELRDNDVHRWRDDFLGALLASRARSNRGSAAPGPSAEPNDGDPSDGWSCGAAVPSDRPLLGRMTASRRDGYVVHLQGHANGSADPRYL